MEPEIAPTFGPGRLIAVLLILIGVGFAALGHSMLSGAGVTLRLFLAGPVLAGCGLAMLIFPGAPMSFADTRSGQVPPAHLWTAAPMAHKVAWVLGGLLGFAVGSLVGLTG